MDQYMTILFGVFRRFCIIVNGQTVRVASPESAGSGGSRHRRSASSPPPSNRIEDYRQLHGLSISDAAFSLIGDSWGGSFSARYDAVWACFKAFLHAKGVPLSAVGIDVIMDYLASLFSAGRAYRTNDIFCPRQN